MRVQLRASLGQTLNLSPQLAQSIRLLQLSTVELEQELAQAVESNPLLEWADSIESAMPTVKGESPAADAAATSDSTDAEPDMEHWTSSASGSFNDDNDDNPLNRIAAPLSLTDHLLWQLHLSHLSRRDRHIGAVLINLLDDDGYLREPVSVVIQTLHPEIQATADEIHIVLRHIQHFDPPGIAARDLQECLSLQLDLLSSDTPGLPLARQLISKALEQLPRTPLAKLARQFKQPVEHVESAVQLLRALDPYPGRSLADLPRDTYIVPDCIVWKQQGQWQVKLAAQTGPKLVIHRGYEQLITQCSASEATYLREHLQQAQWLLKGVQARGQTLLRVMQCLVQQQSAFLEFGSPALRPLTLADVAGQLELHDSTVSRAISRKYVLTPRGTLALRDFFAAGMSAEGGGELSNTAIQAMIQNLIAHENPQKPLSDARLVSLLKAEGVAVARRTVAKYREVIGLPPSHQRAQRL